ncbi:UPF0175 family protein [Hymenobacter cheonanensis]|uniref:UPF0175 family protein n=1 Tax=Hymenobacter sp. CA2-7 TaxID=3063993 RepID=UPI002713112F|nr:UPF0175 family protein [Hymenobacter sp. CA2-7]MDO7887053.1 UPF0175 family protein [Hymenobacter sp. CA2-7]
MKTLTIDIPHELTPQQEHDLKMELAGTLYTKGLLSTAAAAALVGIGRREFIEQMGKYGFSPLATYSETDFDEDLASIQRYLGRELPDTAR